MGKAAKGQWQCFEDDVFDAVKKALREKYRLPVDIGKPKFRRNAEYVGSSKNQYKIEISVEFFRSGAEEPYWIWLWECKQKGKRKVELGDVAELSEKLSDIGKSRCMGSIVTTVGYQKGAVRLAEQHGITLCLLSNGLEYVTRFGKNEPTTSRPVIYVESGIDYGGDPVSGMRFPDYVRQCVRQFLAELRNALYASPPRAGHQGDVFG